MEDIINNTPLPMPAACEQQVLYRIPDLVALPEFCFLTESSFRHLVFNSRTRCGASGQKMVGNGLAESGALIRIGRRILVDPVKFREWLLSHRELAGNA